MCESSLRHICGRNSKQANGHTATENARHTINITCSLQHVFGYGDISLPMSESSFPSIINANTDLHGWHPSSYKHGSPVNNVHDENVQYVWLWSCNPKAQIYNLSSQLAQIHKLLKSKIPMILSKRPNVITLSTARKLENVVSSSYASDSLQIDFTAVLPALRSFYKHMDQTVSMTHYSTMLVSRSVLLQIAGAIYRDVQYWFVYILRFEHRVYGVQRQMFTALATMHSQ